MLVCLAVGGNHTGSGDDVIGLTLGGIVEERLGDGAQRNAFLGDQNEGTLDEVGAVLYGLFAGVTPATFRALTESLTEAREA